MWQMMYGRFIRYSSISLNHYSGKRRKNKYPELVRQVTGFRLPHVVRFNASTLRFFFFESFL